MTTNPMDSHRDIHSWPYTWSKDWHPVCDEVIEDVRGSFPFVDVWTYENHINPLDDDGPGVEDRALDFYIGGGPFPRNQLPPDTGDALADWLVANLGEEIEALLWNHLVWTPAEEWVMWTGGQGDFVDHVHVQFDLVKLGTRYGVPIVIEPEV